MISHSIKVYHEAEYLPVSQQKDKPRFSAGSSQHMDYIRDATINRAKQLYQDGVYVVLKHGTNGDVGCVTEICVDEERGMKWSHMKCRPVEVYWYEGKRTEVYHPDELTYYEGN